MGMNGPDLAPRDPEVQHLLCEMQKALGAEPDEFRRRQIIKQTAEELEPLGDDVAEDDFYNILVNALGYDEDFVTAAMASGFRASKERRTEVDRIAGQYEFVPFPRTARLNGAAKHSPAKSNWRDNVIAARDLCSKAFPPLKWVIPGLLPEGVTLLASRPKVGKSWLLQQIGAAKAAGLATLSAIEITAGDVLYLNLEDGWRRAQRRMRRYFGDLESNWPEAFELARSWRPLDQGGVEDLREWCKEVERPSLIMIDTLAKVRSPKKGGQTDYAADYAACEPLVGLVHEFAGLGVIVSCHVRKMDAEDIFDTVSGTLGLTGGVDAIAILKRSNGAVSLHIEGRDLPEDIEKAVSFDRETCRWEILGDTAEVNQSDTRRAILEALATPLRPREVADVTGIDGNTVRQQLFQMAGKGLIHKVGDKYQVAAQS